MAIVVFLVSGCRIQINATDSRVVLRWSRVVDPAGLIGTYIYCRVLSAQAEVFEELSGCMALDDQQQAESKTERVELHPGEWFGFTRYFKQN